MTLSTKQIIPRDPVTGEWEPRTDEEREALMAKLYPEEREWAAMWEPKPSPWKLPTIIASGLAVLLAGLVWGCDSYAQDGLQSSRPHGEFGVGHEAYHDWYYGLRNAVGGSCCNGIDCRPTTGRWNDETQTWSFELGEGNWRTLLPGEAYKVITGEMLAQQNRPRPEDANSAHVCTNPNSSTVYCFIAPASGG